MLCSLCLFEIGENKPIALFINNEVTELAKIIEQNKLIKKESIGESTYANICQKCLMRLNDFYDFCNYVKERQSALVDADLTLQQNVAVNIKSECSDNENERGCDDDIDNTDAPDINDEEKLNESPLSEAEYYFDLTNITANIKEDNILLTETTKYLPSALVIGEKSQCNITKRATRRYSSIRKSENIDTVGNRKYKKKKCSDESEDPDCPMKSKAKKIKQSNNRKSISGSEYDEIIAKHLSIKCELCDAVEKTFLKLQTHYRTIHECEGYLRCCEKLFKKRLPLAEHISLHINPASFQCNICSKRMKSALYLKKHMDDKHPAEHQLRYKCDQCDKAFAHKQNAERHRESHVIGKHHQCQECKKCFKTKYGLAKHKVLQHSAAPKHYICDICGRVFKFQPSFKRHLAEHQGIAVNAPTHQCDLCGEWFTRIGLYKHMDRHNHVDVKCDICGKVNVSKTALRRHLERHHKELKILNCPYCEKTFKRNTALKEHIAIHTDQKNYVCKFCNKEFRSNANMYAHRKRNHGKELELERLANKKRPPNLSGQTLQ